MTASNPSPLVDTVGEPASGGVRLPLRQLRSDYRSNMLEHLFAEALRERRHGSPDEMRRALWADLSPMARCYDRTTAWRETVRDFAVGVADAMLEGDDWGRDYFTAGYRAAKARADFWFDRWAALAEATR